MSAVTLILTDLTDGGVDVAVEYGGGKGEIVEMTPARAMALLMLAYLKDCETLGRAPLPMVRPENRLLN